MILGRLLGDIPPATFLEEYYLRLPFSRPGGCLDLAPLGSWTTVAALLAQPQADVLVGREGRRWKGGRPASAEQARDLVSAGYTIGIRHAEAHDGALPALAADFRRDLGGPVDIHLYCTPAGQPGFGWHYDAEEVFILQTQGSKEWWLRKNTVNPWPLVETMPRDLRYPREIMPLLRCPLAAGDWLYIPSGYWHRTQAGEESISLSVGIRAPNAVDVFDFLRPRLLGSLRWRQRLPAPGAASPLSTDDLARRYHELFQELGRDLADLLSREETARAFLAAKQQESGAADRPG